MTPVQYVGIREPHQDCLYGTKIVFMKGQSVLIPDDIAKRMFKEHPSIYVRGDELLSDTVTPAPESPVRKGEEPEIQDMRDLIQTMDTATLRKKAECDYGVKFNPRMGVDKMRQELTGLVDRFGIIS